MNNNKTKRAKRITDKVRSVNRVVKLTDIGRFAPARTFCRLRWKDTTLSRTSVSSNARNWSYRSSAFDPDPGVLTSGIPGFAELANFYSMYRVHIMSMSIEVCNQENQAVTVVAWPSMVGQNVNSLSSTDLLEYSGNPLGQTHMLAAVNGESRTRFSVIADSRLLVGPNFGTDLEYASSTSSNPNITYSINVGCFNHISNFSFDTPVLVSIVYDIEFFEVRQLQS